MNYLEKIKQLNKIKTATICKELKIEYHNLLNGRTTKENEKLIYEELVKRYEEVINGE